MAPVDAIPFLKEADICRWRLERPDDGHKGTFGSVLVWAGSLTFAGAAHMCAMGALRSGVGLVHLLLPEELTPFFSAISPPVITHAVREDETLSLLTSFWRKGKALVIGPGLTIEDGFLSDGLLLSAEKANQLVLDAGALSFFARYPDHFQRTFSLRRKAGVPPAVLTPHPGEFSRLFPEFAQRERDALSFAKQNDCITVLKGKNTVIAAPDGRCFLNPTGNDGLSKGGSGDILSGMIGSLLAQGMEPFEAACCGVYFHGLAGDLAAEKLGKRYMQPTDLPPFFSEAFRKCGW